MTWYGRVLLLIAVLDLFSTTLGIQLGVLDEANSFMKWHLERGGLLLFASVKILMTSLCILTLETIWEKKLIKHSLLKKYYTGAIVLYILLYAILVALIHKSILFKFVF